MSRGQVQTGIDRNLTTTNPALDHPLQALCARTDGQSRQE
jgi:hypothetical protein